MSNKQYFNLEIPAPRRLAMMRRDLEQHAAKYPRCPEYIKPKTWRDIRAYTFGSWRAAFCAGINPGRGQWYTHDGEQFRNEHDASRHGYYTNTDCSDSAIGIVANLPHGRFIAGYRDTDTDERVYFPDVFDDETDAARMADEHALVYAESAMDYSERFDAMQDAESAVDDAQETATHAIQARNVSTWHRASARDSIRALRDAMETLQHATKVYES